LMSEYLKYLPALGRLGLTRFVNLLVGRDKVAETAPEP
jgi:hypothetical protein